MPKFTFKIPKRIILLIQIPVPLHQKLGRTDPPKGKKRINYNN